MPYIKFCRVWNINPYNPRARAAYDIWTDNLQEFRMIEEKRTTGEDDIEIIFEYRNPYHWVVLIFIILGILFLWFIAPSLML